jgi:hypothetical protein
MSVAAILAEARRIYTFDEPRFDADALDDLAPEEADAWAMASAELQALAQFIGAEESLPHPRVRSLYGPFEIAEWNSVEGTFGQLRDSDPEYPFDRVVKFGDDLFLDVAGQIGAAGGVYRCIGHDLDGAEPVAESLLALLRQAGSYR